MTGVHTTAIPNVGGLGMLLGLVIALAFAQSLGRFDALFDGSIEHIGVILAVLAITAIGFFDDTETLLLGQSDWHRRCRNVVDVVWGDDVLLAFLISTCLFCRVTGSRW